MLKIKHRAIVAYRLLRIRTVLLMVAFEAIGYEAAGPSKGLKFGLVIAALIVGLLYINSTSINDISDQEVDAVNLPNDLSRPLITSSATVKDLKIVSAGAILVAAILALLINQNYLFLVAAGVIIGTCYSLPPFRISYRGIFAPIWLSFNYVVIPFLAGSFLFRTNLPRIAWLVLVSMYVSFIGRIILKDFRDYKGDKKFNKLNFLVRHGPKLTCIVSAFAWLAGDLILALGYHSLSWVFIIIYQPLIVVIIYQLRLLSGEKDYKTQLRKVLIIGRMGNAIAVALLADLSLRAFNYSSVEKALIILIVTVFMAGIVFNFWQSGSTNNSKYKKA